MLKLAVIAVCAMPFADTETVAAVFRANLQLIEFIDSMSCEFTIERSDERGRESQTGLYRRAGDRETLQLTRASMPFTAVRDGVKIYQSVPSLNRMIISRHGPLTGGQSDPWSGFGLREMQDQHQAFKRAKARGRDSFKYLSPIANPPGVPASAVTVRRTTRGADPKVTIQFEDTFDPSVGGLRVRTASNAKIADSEVLTLSVLSDVSQVAPGVYLPRSVVYTRTDGRTGKELERTVLTVRDLKVNQPIPATDFAIKYRAGTTVWDDIRDVEYKCDDKGQPVGPVRPRGQVVTPPPKK